MSLQSILEQQKEFQKLCDVNIETIVASEINSISEMYLFKAIEEIIELRKTFPSELNKWSKKQGLDDRDEVLAELSDVLLFLTNFMLVRKIKPEEVLETIQEVQSNNFLKLKQRKLANLNDEMLRVPNKRVGLGGGSLMPKAIVIGQNPGNGLNADQDCWNNAPKAGSAAFLQRAIKLGKDVLPFTVDDVYFTNVVKEVTDNNSVPSYTMIKFWLPFLERELKIISTGITPIYFAMGKEAGRALVQEEFAIPFEPIAHPSYYMRNGFTEKQYLETSLLRRIHDKTDNTEDS